MSLWKPEPDRCLWIGAADWRLEVDGQVRASGELSIPAPADLAAAVGSITWPAEWRRGSLRVVVDDRWCRSFMVRAPSNARSAAELDLCIQARMHALFGDDETPWVLIADRRVSGLFVACAVPKALVDALGALAQAAGARLESIRPTWVQVCVHHATPGWAAILAEHTQSLVFAGRDGVGHVRTSTSAEPLDAEAMQRWFRLERSRADLDEARSAGTWVTVTVGAPLPQGMAQAGRPSRGRARGVDSIDFASGRSAWRWPGRAAAWPLAMSAALLVAAGLLSWADAVATAQAESTVREELAQVLAAANTALPRPAAKTEPAAAASLNGAAAAAVVERLNTPWPRLLGSLENASSPDVALLSLSIDAAQTVVRLKALARDEASMFAYVRQLNAGAALSQARLSNHSVDESLPGQPVRFAVEAAMGNSSRTGEVAP